MIKIAYLPDWEYQETWYPVLFFQKFENNNEWFKDLYQLMDKLRKENFSYNLANYPSLYKLINIKSIIFESKNWAKTFSKYIEEDGIFISSMDKKYWKIFSEFIYNVSQHNSGHFYSWDNEMKYIMNELEDNLSMIFDNSSTFIDLNKHFKQ